MSIKKVLKYGDERLRQKSKEVHKISKKIQILIDDLLDTLYAQNGVGLAAPQIGEQIRIFVIDISTGNEPLNPVVFINPKIIKREGAVVSSEGCLSFPEAYTNVKRYKDIAIKALDRRGKPFILEGKDGTLLSRCLQHEYDHLDGILFIDHVTNRFEADLVLQEKGLPPIEADFILEEKELESQICEQPEDNTKDE